MNFLSCIGSKNRIAAQIAERLHATGRTCLVDVFGGSASVLLNAGFRKRIYNDADGDLVNMFRVLADPALRQSFLRRLRWTPAARQIFGSDHAKYLAGGLSFRLIVDPAERACALFYRLAFAYGGKLKNGGFSVSPNGRPKIKEIARYRARLRIAARVGDIFRDTVIENLDYQDIIAMYGNSPDAVLYVDPPYVGTEAYYPVRFRTGDHVFLASALHECSAPAVVSYYDHPLIRELYPEKTWRWQTIAARRNCSLLNLKAGRHIAMTEELVLSKRM